MNSFKRQVQICGDCQGIFHFVFSDLIENILNLTGDVIRLNAYIIANNEHMLFIFFRSFPLDLRNYGIYNGIYGYVSAPAIDMKLPIQLGANDSTMSCGAAHLTYTSLPVGGKSTNAVLAAHTGFIGRIFFDNIKNLNIGDEVTVTNYWGTLKYNVKSKKTVAPDKSQDIYISDGEDLLTLITCISDGNGGLIRYLVICERN